MATKKDAVIAKMEKNLSRLTEDGFRITKVVSKKDKITIISEQYRNGEHVESKLDCEDKANPEFYKAFGDMAKCMKDRIEKSVAIQADGYKCQGISIDYADDDGERMGMIATLFVPTSDMNGGITINTPRLIEKKGGGAGQASMSDKILGTVKTLLREADKYREGDRAQQVLVKDDKKKKKEDADEGEE